MSKMLNKDQVVKKEDLVKKLVEEFNYSKKEASDILNKVFSDVAEYVKNHIPVKLPGVGVIGVKERAARQGVNPQNPSEKIDLPASHGVSFEPSKTLKDSVKTDSETK